MDSGGNRERKKEERERNGDHIMCRVRDLLFLILTNNAIF